MNHCEFILGDSSQCRAYKQKGGQYCFKHNQSPEERSLMAQQGGLSGKAIVGFGNRIEIKNPRQIRKALVNTLNLLKDGQIEPSVANSIGYLCGVIIKTFELIEFEGRMKELESRVEGGKDNIIVNYKLRFDSEGKPIMDNNEIQRLAEEQKQTRQE